jgi:hypothetical protein
VKLVGVNTLPKLIEDCRGSEEEKDWKERRKDSNESGADVCPCTWRSLKEQSGQSRARPPDEKRWKREGSRLKATSTYTPGEARLCAALRGRTSGVESRREEGKGTQCGTAVTPACHWQCSLFGFEWSVASRSALLRPNLGSGVKLVKAVPPKKGK